MAFDFTLFTPEQWLADPWARLGVAVAALGVFLLLGALARRHLGKRLTDWAAAHHVNADTETLGVILRQAWLLLNFVALDVFLGVLEPPGRVARWQGHVFLVLFTWIAVTLGFNLVKFALDLSLRRRGATLAEHRGRVLLPVVKGVIWILAAAFLLDNFGVQVTTILAGLGVAGVAVGFAAQAVLGDLFSYFAILFDHPFRIGDFIVLDAGFRGEIEHIGLKTTRLRSLDGEQIVLSNTDLTSSRVKNYRRMVRRRAVFGFGVLYATPVDVVERIPGWVREIIDEVDRATFDRAHFVRFGESSLDFEVVYYVETPEYTDWMDIQQRINLRLMRRFEAEGVGFAFPTRTVYLEREAEEAHA
ncbi:MAG: mechanosensitive ion channel family protein [Desulfovibrionaceae bacterium]